MPCQCPQCTDDSGPTYTPTYAAQCLQSWVDAKATEILALPSKQERKEALEALTEARAPKLRARVEIAIMEQWGKR